VAARPDLDIDGWEDFVFDQLLYDANFWPVGGWEDFVFDQLLYDTNFWPVNPFSACLPHSGRQKLRRQVPVYRIAVDDDLCQFETPFVPHSKLTLANDCVWVPFSIHRCLSCINSSASYNWCGTLILLLLSGDFDRMFFACLSSVDPSRAACVYNTHARSSADSFAVGNGVWSVFVMFSLAYFGTQSWILFPAKRYFEGLTAKYFSRENICVYGM
jgi:hypothetical protein